jgi:Cu/Ag efflux protein CusF
MTRTLIAMAFGIALPISIGCGDTAKIEPAPATKTEQAPPPAASTAATKPEHVFRGKVEQVDTKAKTLTVNGENVEGWMAAMTMTYSADKPDVYDKVKAGDQITAKVYDGDFSTLHDVQVVGK